MFLLVRYWYWKSEQQVHVHSCHHCGVGVIIEDVYHFLRYRMWLLPDLLATSNMGGARNRNIAESFRHITEFRRRKESWKAKAVSPFSKPRSIENFTLQGKYGSQNLASGSNDQYLLKLLLWNVCVCHMFYLFSFPPFFTWAHFDVLFFEGGIHKHCFQISSLYDKYSRYIYYFFIRIQFGEQRTGKFKTYCIFRKTKFYQIENIANWWNKSKKKLRRKYILYLLRFGKQSLYPRRLIILRHSFEKKLEPEVRKVFQPWFIYPFK